MAVAAPRSAWAQQADMDESDLPARAYAALGASVFADNCAPCHGAAGAGDGPVLADAEHGMIDFGAADALAGRAPADWYQATRDGRSAALMPPWRNQLSDTQIWDVVAFLWQLSASAEQLAAGETQWRALQASLTPAQQAEREGWAVPQALTLSRTAWSQALQADGPSERTAGLTEAEADAIYRYLQSRAFAPAWEPLLQPGTGALKVTVKPGSPNMSLPAAWPVRLQAFVEDEAVGDWQDAWNESREAVFSGLDAAPRVAYQASMQWAGLDFRSDKAFLAGDASASVLELTVFEPSADQAALEIEQLQLLLSISADKFLVGQQVRVVNALPYAFTGQAAPDAPQPVTTRIPLFPNAVDVFIAEAAEGRFVTTAGWAYDTAPVFPAPRSAWVTLGYGLPLPAAPETVRQHWPYPLRDVTVFIPQRSDLSVDLPGFARQGVRDIADQPFDVWHADRVPNGQVALRFARVPVLTDALGAPPRVYLMQPWVPWALGGALLLLILGVMLWPAARRAGVPRRP